jgi:flagellar M-ring protein FliF
VALGAIGVSVFAMAGLAGYFCTGQRPKYCMPILTGRIAEVLEVLKESDIPFDLNSDGKPVLVGSYVRASA